MSSKIYSSAPQQLRLFILSQAERRLADQNSFAQAADARASAVTSAAAALAAASAGLMGVALAALPNLPLAAGALVGVIGFACSAERALRSAKCLEFHPGGYPPAAFADDIESNKPRSEIEAEILAELDSRLAFNSKILKDRGGIIDEALRQLWTTPFYAGVAVLITWLAVLAVPKA